MPFYRDYDLAASLKEKEFIVLHNLSSGKGHLKVNLTTLKQNYDTLKKISKAAECAPVLKANAYGLGLEPIATTLSASGASVFFVALPEEGEVLRKILPSAQIFVLHGFMKDGAEWMAQRKLVPVLNTLSQAYEWQNFCQVTKKNHPVALQLDTGMSRFGLSETDLSHEWLKKLPLCLIMSHLACADDPCNPANRQQRTKFEYLADGFRGVPRSLSASSGIFLGEEFRFDLVRPGASLYGIAPQNDAPNPLLPVVSLQVPVCQIREIPAGSFIGYGYSCQVTHRTRVATIAIGYADGFFRQLSGKGLLWFKKTPLPVLGRVSMDSICVDITALEENSLKEGDYLTVIGPEQSVDDVAKQANTIGYEVLTSLGTRFERSFYLEENADPFCVT